MIVWWFLLFILGPVGSGRDRKNEEKVMKYESDLVIVQTIKDSGLYNYEKINIIGII